MLRKQEEPTLLGGQSPLTAPRNREGCHDSSTDLAPSAARSVNSRTGGSRRTAEPPKKSSLRKRGSRRRALIPPCGSPLISTTKSVSLPVSMLAPLIGDDERGARQHDVRDAIERVSRDDDAVERRLGAGDVRRSRFGAASVGRPRFACAAGAAASVPCTSTPRSSAPRAIVDVAQRGEDVGADRLVGIADRDGASNTG